MTIKSIVLFIHFCAKVTKAVSKIDCEGGSRQWHEAHSQEEVKQLADIDLFRVKWRSRKADTLSLLCLCAFICTSHTYTVHTHIHKYSLIAMNNDYS